MKTLIIILTAIGLHFTDSSVKFDKVLRHYLLVKNALVASDVNTAIKATVSMEEELKNQSKYPEQTELLGITAKLKNQSSIEKFRTDFGKLSIKLWPLIKADASLKTIYYYQYCPMKKMYWISESKEIRNPYYGKNMLTCGEVVETSK